MELLTGLLDMVAKFCVIAGGLWAVWGVINLAGAMKDSNGPEMKSSIWQIAGGGMIIVAAALFATLLV